MIIEKTNIEDCLIITPNVYKDKRGYFFESFNQSSFKTETGLDISFVQDNESYSTRGVLRGLHYQTGEYAQAKLVRVIKGKILDIAVDLRENSKSYGKHTSIILSDENRKQLFIPRGFAHGFVVLSDEVIFSYKCDNYYNKSSEAGLIYNDPQLKLNWLLSEDELLISDKDLKLPRLVDIKR